MAANRDLVVSPTRVMPITHRQRPDAVMVGTATELADATRGGQGVKAVGRYTPREDGRYSVPVVYVSKRANPWYGRRWVHITSIIVGTVLFLAALITWAILSLGLAGFIVAIVVGAFLVAGLARFSRGGGGGRSVSVTTTTTTNVRVK